MGEFLVTHARRRLQLHTQTSFTQLTWGRCKRAVTVTNLSPASRGHPSSRTLKSRLRYKLDHRVVGEVYYNLYARGARPACAVCLWCTL